MKKKNLFITILLINFSFSQFLKKNEVLKISYTLNNFGNTTTNIISYSDGRELLIGKESFYNSNFQLPEEIKYIDFTKGKTESACLLKGGLKFKVIDSLKKSNYVYEFTNEKKKILGYECKKAKRLINSNTVEYWYLENELQISPNNQALNLGIVLEIYRNGQIWYQANKIEKIKNYSFKNFYSNDSYKPIDGLSYREEVWKSQFETISIFQQEQLCFNKDYVPSEGVKKFHNGTVLFKKIKFPKIHPGQLVFLDVKEQSNGDAYDRTGTVFLLPEEEGNVLEYSDEKINFLKNSKQKELGLYTTSLFTSPVELMRFITPFGVNKYNHIEIKGKKWNDHVFYRQDVSELSAFLSEKEIWIGINIGNYDKGGHLVDVNLTIHPLDVHPMKFNFSQSLFNTMSSLSFAEIKNIETHQLFIDNELVVNFDLDNDLDNAQLRYLVTGHGGWDLGDEFIPKTNYIYIDNQLTHQFIPWRGDCGSYRLNNPASGNFPSGLSSSDYSRSNWCPGTVTSPDYIILGNLKAGKHILKIKIDQGKPDNGQNSTWTVSGVLLGNKK